LFVCFFLFFYPTHIDTNQIPTKPNPRSPHLGPATPAATPPPLAPRAAAAAFDPNANAPRQFKKLQGRTWLDVLADPSGRSYLHWAGEKFEGDLRQVAIDALAYAKSVGLYGSARRRGPGRAEARPKPSAKAPDAAPDAPDAPDPEAGSEAGSGSGSGSGSEGDGSGAGDGESGASENAEEAAAGDEKKN
jgi:hypothetical protein